MTDEFLAMLELMPDAMVLVDFAGKVVGTNSAASALFGYPSGALHDQPLSLLLPDDLRPAHEGHVHRFLEKPSRRAMSNRAGLRARRADGTEVPVEVALNVVKGQALVLAAVRDVSDRLELERVAHEQRDRIASMERFATLGLLASSVAHELNNPLASLLCNLDLLRTAQGHEFEALVADCEEATRHVRVVANDLLTMGRQPKTEPVDLGKVVESALRMTHVVLRERASLEVSLAPAPQVKGASGRLVQVVINLLLNAEQAMAEVPERRHELCVAVAEVGGGVACTISDTGPGIPSDVRSRLFDRFVTGKKHGTGLGLAFCKQVVDELGGTLSVESRPGRTTFEVWLPRWA